MGQPTYLAAFGRHLIAPGDRVIVGVSGGPDSMALLYQLLALQAEVPFQLFVVHVIHGIRGAVAEAEAQFVAEEAARHHLAYLQFSFAVPAQAAKAGRSLEAVGHDVRFAAFDQARQIFDANKLALGHHQDDRAESVLMHMIRGTGLAGLGSLSAQRDWVIRPVIALSKAELIAYCQDGRIRYYEDQSNKEAHCLRNQIRLELLPQLASTYNPQIVSQLVQLSHIAAVAEDYLTTVGEDCLQQALLDESPQQIVLDLRPLRAVHEAVISQVWRLLWHKTGVERDLSYRQLASLNRLIHTDAGEKIVTLPEGWGITKSYDRLYLAHQSYERAQGAPLAAMTWDWQREKSCTFGDWIFYRLEPGEAWPNANGYQLIADPSWPQTLLIRTRQAGDHLRPKGMTGQKKIKDLMIDAKVPRFLRASWALLVAGTTILWVPGLAAALSPGDKADLRIFCTCWNNEQDFFYATLNVTNIAGLPETPGIPTVGERSCCSIYEKL